MRREHIHVLLVQQMRHAVRGGAVVQQSALFRRFLDPGVVVAVAVEDDPSVILDSALYHLVELVLEVLCALEPVGVDPETLSHGAVEHDVGAGNAVGGPEHTELELVSGESEGRRAVAVRGISVELREHVHAELHLCLFGAHVGGVVLDGLQYRVQLVAEEHGDHRGRRLVCAEAVVVARRGNGYTEQILIIVYRLDDSAEEEQELSVFIGSIAGGQQVLSLVGGDGPVVVLA